MKNTNSLATLKDNILVLENKQTEQLKELKSQFEITYQSLNPVSFIKNTISDVVTSPGVKHSLFDNLKGLAIGYLSKKILIGGSTNPIKNILGTRLQYGIANFVTKNADSKTINQ